MGNAERKARENVDNPQNDQVKRQPQVGTCYAEDLIGQALYASKSEIENANNNLLDNVNSFLEDIQDELAGVSGTLSDITNLLGGISGSMTAALSFSNISLNVFGCELTPNLAVSDKYCMANGGSAQPDSSLPSAKSIENATNRENETPKEAPEETPFASPPTSQPDIDLDTPISQQERDAVRQGNIVDAQGNNIGTISSGGSSTQPPLAPPASGTPEQIRAERVARLGEDRVRAIEERAAARRRAGAE